LRLVLGFGDLDPNPARNRPVKLPWGDVDLAECRLRIGGKTSAARRWVPIPELLMEEIEATCPLDDRTALRRVFPGSGRQTIGNAGENAGIANYSSHDLRHRYISVKIREEIPVTQIAAHVGQSRKSDARHLRSRLDRRVIANARSL